MILFVPILAMIGLSFFNLVFDLATLNIGNNNFSSSNFLKPEDVCSTPTVIMLLLLVLKYSKAVFINSPPSSNNISLELGPSNCFIL